MFGQGKTKRLIREASDDNSPKRLEAIRALGRRAMSDDIIACLSAVVRQCRQRPTGMAREAANALAQSRDARVSTALAQLLDHESTYDLQTFLVGELGHPRHNSAVPLIVAAARRELSARGHCNWLEATLAAIATPEARRAWESYRIASVGPILNAALAALTVTVIADGAEQELTDIGTAEAMRALNTLRREMVRAMRHVALTSDDYDGVGQAVARLETLNGLGVPGSGEALRDFLSKPARRLVQWIDRQEHVESGALQSWTDRVERSSADFGQRAKA